MDFGPNPGDSHHNYVRPRYWFLVGDRRLPVDANGSGRALMGVIVLPTDADAARCARAGIYQAEHMPTGPAPSDETEPYRLIHGTTVAWGRPGASNFETYIARGQVLAEGWAKNAHDSAIVRTDLLRLAAQTASG
jgi:hypothetical protein